MGFARLVAFARGQIWGMRQAGAKREAIADTVRLEKKAPAIVESRPQSVQRLRRTASWLNARQRNSGRKLCRGQKRRATAILQLRGAECKY